MVETKEDSEGILMWKYENQTKIKHRAFEEYFGVWTKIYDTFTNVNYIDCFGGIGRYYDEKDKIYDGSPVIASKIILNNIKKNKAGFIVIEKDKKCVENLKKIFEKEEIKPKIILGDFDEIMNKNILDKDLNFAPTFFFVDPFGIKIKIETLKKMMKIEKSEVLFNFMYQGAARNFEMQNKETIFNELYGSNVWKEYKTEKERVEGLKQEFKKFSKFVMVYKLMFPDKNQTYYYLFHLSNHIMGASIMKDCFAKYNYGRIEYLGKRAKQLTLFESLNLKAQQLEEDIFEKYKGLTKTYQEILEELIDEIPSLEREICFTIKDLEKKEKIIIKRIPKLTPTGKKRQKIIGSDEILFNKSQ